MESPLPLEPGSFVFSRFRLVRSLGEGGMGVVWQAHDEALSQDIALKFLPKGVVDDPKKLQKLRAEIVRARRLTDPGIVRVYDLHQDEKQKLVAISMEYVPGENLLDLKNAQPQYCFDVTEPFETLVVELCQTLNYIHEQADDGLVIHRDLKPLNVMITTRGRVKLVDFGIAVTFMRSRAWLTHEPEREGTPLYMSPEQYKGGLTPGPADDIYSLGALLYELLTSKPPFYQGSTEAIFYQLLHNIPPPMNVRRAELGIAGRPAIPQAWEMTIAACLEKEAVNRPQSVTSVLERLNLHPASPKENAGHPSAEIPVRTRLSSMAMAELLKDFMLLMADSKDLHEEDSPAYQLFEQINRDLHLDYLRCNRPAGAFKVAVVGLSSVDKSTLVNALLGAPLAVGRSGPCRGCIVEFKHGEECQIEGFTNSLFPETLRFASMEDLSRTLGKMSSRSDSEGQKWGRLVVSCPCSLLKRGLVLVDTPAYRGAGEGGTQEDKAMTQFLREGAAHVFWVISANDKIGDLEREVVTSALRERCDDLIVTDTENRNVDGIAKLEEILRPLLPLQTRIHYVSGKITNGAQVREEPVTWEQSGFQVLVARITNLAENPFSAGTVMGKLIYLASAIKRKLRAEEFARSHRGLFSPVAASLLLPKLPPELRLSDWGLLLRPPEGR